MDIHRCRFVPHPASAINTLAFSHTTSNPSIKAPSTLRLAVGRANGDIEIWDPKNGLWVQESILKGGKDRSIEGLAWTHDLEDEGSDGTRLPTKLRLFSIGYSTVVTEWDLATGKALHHSSGNYGEIWCMAAQPRWQNHKDPAQASKEGPRADQLLAIGCEDGSIILHSTADSDLKYERTLPRPSGKKGRALSIAFQNRQKLVAGFSDSTIRIFDVQGRTQIINMSLGAGPKKGPQEILVWSVKCLRDGTIISGDSTGEVKFWDSKTYALVQRIASHSADVFDLAPSWDGLSLFSGGMDRKTVLYKRRTEGKKKVRWAEITHARLHSTDVKAMASFEASLDTSLIILPQGRLGQELSRALPALPNRPPLGCAPSQRMFLVWWNREVCIWLLDPSSEPAARVDDLEQSPAHRLMVKIIVQKEENITSASMSRNGDLVAISTISCVKLFSLKPRSSFQGLRAHKVELSKPLTGHGARAVEFSPDSRWLLVVTLDSSITVHRIQEDGSTKSGIAMSPSVTKLRRNTAKEVHSKSSDGTHGAYLRSVSRVAWSSDSRLVAVCDLSGNFDSWMLEGLEDLAQENEGEIADDASSSDESEADSDEETKPRVILGQHWKHIKIRLPKLPSAPLILSFRPASTPPPSAKMNGNLGIHPTRHNPHPQSHDVPDGEDRLLVVTSQHQLLEYSVMTGQLTDWSRRNPSFCLPLEFRNTRDRVMGCVWDVSENRQRLWLYGSTWLWMFNIAQDMGADPQEGDIINGDADNTSRKKRKRGEMEAERRQLMSNTSGAGSKVPAHRRTDGFGAGMSIIDNDSDARAWRSFDPDRRHGSRDMDVDDDAESSSGESASPDLVRMRRAAGVGASSQSKELVTTNGINAAADKAGKDALSSPSYWRTYKYRPILGMVPIGGGSSSELVEVADARESSKNVEVALIERPEWDLDLAPRWEGNQEWSR